MILDRSSFGIWSFIAKRAFRATFVSMEQKSVREGIRGTLKENEVAVYIHIPFCKGSCLYCPYVRFPIGRDLDVLDKYVDAVVSEVQLYGRLLRDHDIKIVDVHAGGGTPSLLRGYHIRRILEALAENLGAEPKIAIEANPEDLKDEKHTFELVESGVSEVSLGVQSFNRRLLGNLGRRHTPEDSLRAINNLREAGIEYLNIDLMYMIPGTRSSPPQSEEEWREDLEIASQQEVDEITCYPTLIADHCAGYRLVRAGGVIQPSRRVFRRMVYMAEDILSSKGFTPVEIYGYSRKEDWKYVTVNYEMEGPLLGLGCGAMGFTGGFEYQNTCSVSDYIEALRESRLPVAGARYVSLSERGIRYATCRLFICRRLNLEEFERKLRRSFEELVGRTGFGRMLRLLEIMGYVSREGAELKLTRKGLFMAHQICWAFVLNVPCRMSEKFLQNPWPKEVQIP